MRRVYIWPNLFTAGSLFCGLMAIFIVFERGDLVAACKLVFLAGVLDVLDGVIARIMHAESSFGLHFDSISDVVAFGVAPAMIAYGGIAEHYPLPARATCGIFVIFSALRLARFNVQAAREEKRSFRGLPSPGAACAVVSVVWVLESHPAAADLFPARIVLPLMMVLLSYLMVSRFPYFSFKSIRHTAREPFEILVSIVVILFVLVILSEHFSLILMVTFGFYALSGPCYSLYRRHWRFRQERRATRDSGGDAPGTITGRPSGR